MVHRKALSMKLKKKINRINKEINKWQIMIILLTMIIILGMAESMERQSSSAAVTITALSPENDSNNSDGE